MIRKLLGKKLLGLVIFAIAICLSISGTSIAFASAAEHTSAENVSIDYLGNVDRSVEIHEQLIGTYQNRQATHNGKDYTVYSDDFAGVFIDEHGLLNIAVVGNTKARSQQASRYDKQVIFKEVAFSYNYLQKIMNAVESIMNYYSINAVGIDDAENLVFIELREKKEVSLIIKHLQSEGLYDEDAIKFEVDANATVQNNARGGDGIISLFRGDAMGSGGTVAVMAICNITGQIGVLTNEHVARVTQNNTTNDIFDGGWTFMGNNNMRGRDGGTIDAAFIPFANHNNWTITPHAGLNTTNYTNIREGNGSHIIKGLPVKKIGQATGITTGTIDDTNITFNSPSATKTNTFRYTNNSELGDSGGPVYYDDGTNLYLIGIHMGSGSGGFLWLNTYGYACRISNVMKPVAQGGLDVTPITNSIFNPILNGSTMQINMYVPEATTHVTIPDTIEDRNVTHIGINAFSGVPNLATVDLPNTLTNIGNSAFFGCTQLSQISIPENVTSIGQSAFQNCTSLTSVALPSGLTTIEMSTFEQCSSLQRITIPESVVSIDSYAFWGCTALKSVNKQGQFATLGSGVFSACYALKNIFVPPERLSYYRGAPNWRNFASTIKSSQETISLMQYFNSASGYLSVGGVSWSDVGRVTFILNLGGGDVFYGSYAKTYIFDNPAEIPLINGYAYSEVVRVVRIGGPPMNMEIGIWLNNTDGIGVGLFFDYDTNGYCQVNAQVIVEYR